MGYTNPKRDVRIRLPPISLAGERGAKQAAVRSEHGGGQVRETFAALCQTGDAGQQMAVFVAAVAMDLAAGRFAGTVQPGAGGKNRAADGSFDEFVPEFRVFYCEDFVGIGHGYIATMMRSV